MKFSSQYVVLSICIAYLFLGCSSVKTVPFENYVDTDSKKVYPQVKTTYSLEDKGVFVSNEFDCARLNGFNQLNDSIAIIDIYPENGPINNSTYYAFKAWSKLPKDYYFQFKYPKGYKHRYIPKIKRNNVWSVLDASKMYKQDSIVTVKLSLTSDPIIVAAQELQSSKEVKDWYTNLMKGKEDYVRLESFGNSVLGRNLPVLDIYKGSAQGKELIVLLTRQHPPEVTGFFAFKAFLKTVLEDSKLSEAFLNKYRIIAFPIMNPDGVDLGHWRHNANGVDTNRDWSKYNQPEIKQAVKYITKQAKKYDNRIILGLDFHSTWHDVFYTNKIRENTTLPNFIEDWFAALEHEIPDYKVNEASGNSTKPVSKGWFLYGHNAVGITYEIGDKTPKGSIDRMGKVSANEMMKILTNR
ncbi:M14 family metallopeptidase [Winogradskyella sp. PG-2]|uniref:M14 family metallopeptidase n=1 Tax=Winogradskyella sp. PG-2 TaxID=754409 RepID=UPI00045865B6|nr:M14 family metallopeptidase [Winogradskyella sp. PG-2]BAO77279.1 zinc carboxypeptidase domain protein [Winogradskyella sp. PG-2]